jgi:hypothetical protein
MTTSKDHITNKLTLHEWSPVSPSIAFCNGNLYLAWKGDYGNDKLNVMVSTDGGASFDYRHLFTSPTETSSDAPALASDGRTLFIAWKGSDNDGLNVATVALDPVSGTPTDIINKAFPGNDKLNETSPVRPALAVLNGNVYLAWKGDGNDELNVSVSTDAGASFPGGPFKFTSTTETSPAAPTLGTNDGSLFIGWKGDGNDNLNVATVVTDPVSGTPTDIINKFIIETETSPVNPALAGLNGDVYLAWKGDGNDNLNVMVSTDAGASFVNPYTSAETSTDAPALASDGSTLFIAWKGSGNDNLNVARVTTLSLSIINPTNPREFQFTGSGWMPGTTVTVTSWYDYADSGSPGGIPVGTNSPYPVAADGTFGDTIRQNFEYSGTLFVEAKDTASDQSATASAPILGG